MRIVCLLSFFHIFIIALSNYVVQFPLTLFGFHTTWGAFTYPFIFIITDLTTRLTSQELARRIVYYSMFPGLIVSYLLTVLLSEDSIFSLQILPMRIAIACFLAYVVGQLLDILVFQKLRSRDNWWKAPFFSSFSGNIIDTYIFFSVAFYKGSDKYLSQHWVEIANVDLFFKILISTLLFVPAYGIILQQVIGNHKKNL